VFPERGLVALAAQLVRAFRAVVRAEQDDPAPPGVEEMGDGGLGGLAVADADVVDGAARLPVADQDHWMGAALVAAAERHRAHDHAVGEDLAAAAEQFQFGLAAAAGGLDEHRRTAGPGSGDDRLGEVGEVPLPEGRDGQCHGPGAAGAQAAGGRVGAVAEGVQAGLDPGAGRGGDVDVVVHHVRNGAL
jgi:hypothetical protein